MIHRCNIVRPAGALDTNGQPLGQPTVVYQDATLVNYRTVGGLETVVGEQQHAISECEFQVRLDPAKRLQHTDYFTDGTLGSRVLNIRHIDDPKQRGELLNIVCGERHDS